MVRQISVQEGVFRTHDTKTESRGKPYFVSYLPIIDETGSAVGMFFAGIPRADVEGAILKSLIIMLAIAAAVVVAFLILAIVLANKMARVVIDADNANSKISSGNLVFTLDERSLQRN